MKLPTKSLNVFPPHCQYVPALPWEFYSSNLSQVMKKMQTGKIIFLDF